MSLLSIRNETGGAPSSPDSSQLENRGDALFWTQLFALVVPFIFVCLRGYVRVVITRRLFWDDWLMLAAMVIYIVYGAFAINGVVNAATGKPLATITIPEAIVSLKAWYICEVLYPPITVLIRTSICIHLLRIATQRRFRWVIFVNIFVIWCISLAFFFIMVFQCIPPSYFWEQLLGKQGRCVGPSVVPDATVAHSIISALSDWCIGLLPIPLLWNVKLNLRTKITVAFMLSMGMMC